MDDAPDDHDFFSKEDRGALELRSDIERPRRLVHKVLAVIVVAGVAVGGWFAITTTSSPGDSSGDSVSSSQEIRESQDGVIAALSMATDGELQLANEHRRLDDGGVELVSSESAAGPHWHALWLDEEPAVAVAVDVTRPWCVVASTVDVDRSPLRVGATGGACTEQGVRPSAQCSGDVLLVILAEAPSVDASAQPWAWRLRADSGSSSFRTELAYEAAVFDIAPRFQTDGAEVIELTVGEHGTTCRRS